MVGAAASAGAVRMALRYLMDEDYREWDYSHYTREGPDPEDWSREHRWRLHHLMRLAYEHEADYVLEDLERRREHVAANLAYVLAHREQRSTPEPANG